MKRLLIKSIMCFAVAVPFTAAAHELLPCVELAANEFKVPANLFKAIVQVTQSEQGRKSESQNDTGVLGMNIKAAQMAANGINVSVDEIENDKCTSYRAAAWWFANQAGATEEAEDWAAVNRYFHGRTAQPNSLVVERVKRAYEQLD